jgi:tRNA(fMet)-specific endonuclease VapC
LPHLLDTNTCIHAMRGTASVITAMAAHDPADLAVSSITSYELHAGVEKCADPARERNKVEQLLNTVQQVEFDLSDARAAARIRADLESRGEMIGPYDVLIAGQAVSLGLILVTDNTNEFARVSGLTLENWQVS